MLAKATLVWLVLVMLAIANGGLRAAILIPRFGENVGHVVSTVLLAFLIVATTWFALPWISLPSIRAAWTIGGFWVALTVAFEFLAGHYVFGSSWERLLADYNVFAGRTWLLVPVATWLAPVFTFKCRQSAKSASA